MSIHNPNGSSGAGVNMRTSTSALHLKKSGVGVNIEFPRVSFVTSGHIEQPKDSAANLGTVITPALVLDSVAVGTAVVVDSAKWWCSAMEIPTSPTGGNMMAVSGTLKKQGSVTWKSHLWHGGNSAKVQPPWTGRIVSDSSNGVVILNVTYTIRSFRDDYGYMTHTTGIQGVNAALGSSTVAAASTTRQYAAGVGSVSNNTTQANESFKIVPIGSAYNYPATFYLGSSIASSIVELTINYAMPPGSTSGYYAKITD